MKNDGNIFKLEKETFLNITSEHCESNESREFISQFKNNLMMRKNPYEKLLTKDNLIELLPDNYLLSAHRLKGLRTRLCKHKGLMIQYNNIYNDYLDNGIIERVDTPADNKELVHFENENLAIT